MRIHRPEAPPSEPRRLVYVADPMCSWCFGFAPVLAEVEARFAESVPVLCVLGGLAPDDDAPMDGETKAYVRAAWRAVAARTGVAFNDAFWERCEPRRSTWPACRAVLVAGERGAEMFAAIQRAYYVEARDPSRRATLLELAGELELDVDAFDRALDANPTRELLALHFAERDRLGVRGYPSLILEQGGAATVIAAGWTPLDLVLERLAASGVTGA